MPESPWAGARGSSPLEAWPQGSGAQLPRPVGWPKAGVTGSFLMMALFWFPAAHEVIFSPGNRDPNSQALLCHPLMAGSPLFHEYSIV